MTHSWTGRCFFMSRDKFEISFGYLNHLLRPLPVYLWEQKSYKKLIISMIIDWSTAELGGLFWRTPPLARYFPCWRAFSSGLQLSPFLALSFFFFWWTHSSFAVVTASWNSYTVRFNQSFPRPCLPVLYWNHFTVNRLQTKYVKIILNGTSLLYRVCKNCTYFKVGLGM